MKKKGLLIVFFILLVSCSFNDNEKKPSEDYYGIWILTRMNRNNNPAANSIDVLEWEESYIFKSDKTFSKTRKRDGKITTASGNYSVIKMVDQTQFELTYAAQSEIIGSCISNLKENLYIINNVGNLLSTWNVCSGPMLVYEKKK